MTIKDFIISSLGSASLLSILFFIFRTTIKRKIEKSIEHSYELKLESHKANLKKETELELKSIENQFTYKLENAKLYLSQYSQKQFELYNDLWISLVELNYSINKLWNERANITNLKDLVKKHTEANKKRLEKAILLEPEHYEELKLILDKIEGFQFGKRTLIELRIRQDKYVDVSTADIDLVIFQNGELKDEFNDYLNRFRLTIQKQIKGEK